MVNIVRFNTTLYRTLYVVIAIVVLLTSLTRLTINIVKSRLYRDDLLKIILLKKFKNLINYPFGN